MHKAKMIPPLQSLVKYDNAVLVSSAKEAKVKDKLLKVVPSAESNHAVPASSRSQSRTDFCSQVECYLGSTNPKCPKLRTYSTLYYRQGILSPNSHQVYCDKSRLSAVCDLKQGVDRGQPTLGSVCVQHTSDQA